MSLSSKREYLARIHARYQRAGRQFKSRILDEFCFNCDYHRKAALRLLLGPLGKWHAERTNCMSPRLFYALACLIRPTRLTKMSEVKDEIEAYEKMQPELEEKHMGKWVLFHEGSFISAYDSFESVAEDAVRRFGRGPYLIRQVGAPSVTLPASVLFRPHYA